METYSIKGGYEGYLWESDKQAPEIYKGEKLSEERTLCKDENPFIIEGLLFNKTTGHSIRIKYVDGEYKVTEYFVKTSQDGKTYFVLKEDDTEKESIICEVKEHHYKGNSKLNGNNLHFYELWEEKPDPLCCNMKVLEATKFIFAGFLG